MRLHKTRLVAAAVAMLPASLLAQASGKLLPGDADAYARILMMADGRKFDSALVRKAFISKSSALRAAAILSIGQLRTSGGGRAGIPVLRVALNDADLHVAADAAYALGLLVDSTSVDVLRTALQKAPQIAREAAWSLGEIGTAAGAAITTALRSSPNDAGVQLQLLLAASKVRPVPVAEIRPFLRSTVAAVQWAAAYAIARPRAAAGARDLIQLANSGDFDRTCTRCNPSPQNVPYLENEIAAHRTRAEVARTLTKTVVGDSLATLAVSVLERLARDVSPHVRINAIRSLATFGPKENAVVTDAVRDPDPNVRIAIAQVVGLVMDTTEGDWAALWSTDTSFMYRTSLATSAVSIGVNPPGMYSWSKSADWRYRAAVINAGSANTDRAMRDSSALYFLKDPDPRVRATAYSALSPRDTLPLNPGIRATFIAALTDSSVDVRSTALSALARRPEIADLDAVLASYRIARKDSANDARIEAAQYLVSLWQRDSANFPASARQTLVALGAPTDPLEREAAGRVSLFTGWPEVLPETRPLSWYENVVRTLVIPSLRGRFPRATIRTERGPIELELFGADAPLTVENFTRLAARGYYNGTRWHRVVPNFVVQDGDPTGTGSGGPGYAIRDEINTRRYERGALGMALSGPDTGGSQYFITHSPQPHLDGHYTVFGRVRSGWAALDAIVQGDRISDVIVLR